MARFLLALALLLGATGAAGAQGLGQGGGGLSVVPAPGISTAGGVIGGSLTVNGVFTNADVTNIKSFGAKGDVIGYADGAISASSSTFTSTAASFTGADIGKSILVHGSGVAGAPQQGTITAFNSAHSVTVSFTASGTVSGANFHYGTDDWLAFKNALAGAVSAGKCLYVPAGGYWLAGQNQALSATGACIRGDGLGGDFFPYVSFGTVFLLTDTSDALFSAIGSTLMRDFAVYYPAQDGYQSTPTTFAALFDISGSNLTRNDVDNIRVINAYRFLHLASTGGIGRTFIRNSKIYAIDMLLFMERGASDVISLSNNLIGPSAYPESTAGNAYLPKYSEASGNLLYADIGASNQTSIDGLLLTDNYVFGYRYGIHMVSGTLDVSTISGTAFDQVLTAFQLDGTSRVLSTRWSGGFVYATNAYDLTQNAPAIYFNTSSGTANSDISISTHFAYTLGPVLKDQLGALRRLNFSNNQVDFLCQSTTATTCYAIQVPGNNTGIITAVGNLINCAGKGNAGSTASGFLVTQAAGGQFDATGNSFTGCTTNVVMQGGAGTAILEGNVSTSTVGNVITDSTTSVGSVVLGINAWDKNTSPRNPSVSLCGTSPSIDAASSNLDGIITVGTGGVTSCQINYTSNLVGVPKSVIVSPQSTTAGTLAITASAVGHFVVSTSAADISGLHFYYHVVQ